MSKLPDIGSDMNQDEKDYAEYIGVGEAHQKPPAKKMRLTTSSVSSLVVDSEVNQEPKSIDVFASSQPSNDGYETCRESIGDEETSGNSGNSAENGPKSSKSTENAQKMTQNSQFLAENAPEIESEDVADSQEVESEGSMEIGEVFDETEIYNAEKREKAAENKLNESNSSQEDEEVLKEMEIEMKTAEENSLQKSPSSQDIFDYDSDNNQIPQYPDVERRHEEEETMIQNSESNEVVRRRADNEEEEMEVDGNEEEEGVKEADDVRMENQEDPREMNPEVVVVGEEEDVEQESETKSESLCRKKIERVSLEPNSGDEYEEIIISSQDESEDVKNAPEEKKATTSSVAPKPKPAPRPRQPNKHLIFKPDFQNCNPKTNYRYCDEKGMPKHDNFYRNGRDRIIVNQDQYTKQTWRDLPNPKYQMNKNFLIRYARENRYKTDSLLLFSSLIHDMCGMTYYHPFPALFGYFAKYESYQGNARYAMDQIGRLVQIALSGYQLLPERIYCLMGEVESATLSHQQCAALIARMFFTLNAPNFMGILNSDSPVAIEKLRFLFAYFDRISANPPEGVVSFRRIDVDEDELRTDKWRERKWQKLPEVTMLDDERIEQTTQCTQVDFANEFLGGGVTKEGSVQEEIRFLMCPEMIVGMLLSKKAMHKTEAFSIVGAYVYSSYEGYGKTLKWKALQPEDADQNDTSLRDKYGRLPVETIAIDAIQYYRPNALREQVAGGSINREILKAITGFTAQDGRPFETVPIRTGWWGCGAFGGCKQMKFIIQVIAAGYARRPLQFCTFGETVLSEQCRKLMAKMKAKNVTIGSLFSILRKLHQLPTLTDSTVFDYISTTISEPGWKNTTPSVPPQRQ